MSITFISVLPSLNSARPKAYKFGMAMVVIQGAITMKSLTLAATPGFEVG